MRPSRIRRKLDQGQPVLVTALSFVDPSIFELTSLLGYDGIWIDLEHHALSLETAQNLMRAARVGVSDIVVRPAKGEFMRLSRLLEAGAQVIIYPRCDNAAEAAEVVKWAKFPPLGKRGVDGGNADMPYCSMPLDQYLKEANEQTFVVIQLEEQHAVDAADEIAAVAGVDAIFFGPGDFSSLSGFPGQTDHPRISKAMQHIAAAAKRAGKHWGRPVSSVSQARECLELGGRFLSHGSDLLIVKHGLEQIQRDFSAEGFSFDNRLTAEPAMPPMLHRPHFSNAAALVSPEKRGG